MRYGVQVLLAVVNLYVRIKIPVATFDTNHSVTDSTRVAASIQKLPDSVVKSVSAARHTHSLCQAGETIRLSIGLRLALEFLRVICIKDK